MKRRREGKVNEKNKGKETKNIARVGIKFGDTKIEKEQNNEIN